MAFKLDRDHRDYLFWIYPLVILGLLIFAINRDELRRDSSVRTGTDVKVDTSMIISVKNEVIDNHKVPESTQQTRYLMVLK